MNKNFWKMHLNYPKFKPNFATKTFMYRNNLPCDIIRQFCYMRIRNTHTIVLILLYVFVFSLPGEKISRPDLGLPEQWNTVVNWLDDSKDIVYHVPTQIELPTLKNTEIPILNSYNGEAPKSFWTIFPQHFDKKVKRTVKIKILKKLIQKCWFQWTLPQRLTAKKTLRRLQGLDSLKLKRNIKGITTKNAHSATKHGVYMTDTICTWLKKGYVVGPYKEPPFSDFRVNPLMAAVQKNKVRPIMNLSSPKGASLNDAIDMLTIEKIGMSSPKLFAEELRKAGKGALFSKNDIVDAYKLIPNAVQQYRLFGFKWLNRYFFDKTKVFGSKEAPASFDSLPETIVNIVCCLYKIPKNHVQRQLETMFRW